MNLNRLGAIALAVSSAVVFTACGDDGDGTTTPMDMGGTTDAEAPDNGVVETDMGAPDMGVDMGIDMGVDMGTVVTAPGEGEACDAMTNPCEDGLSCISFPDSTAPICLRQCAADTDCATSGLLPPATSCAQSIYTLGGAPFSWCVQEVLGEGGVITDPPDPAATGIKLSACDLNTTAVIPITDTELKCVLECDSDLQCAGSVTGANTCGANGICSERLRGEGSLATVSATVTEGCAEGLADFGPDANQPGKIECARTCSTNADCAAPGLTHCRVNRGFFADTIPGVCSRGEGAFGAPCNDSHEVSRCTLDIEGQGLVLCSDFFGLINDNEEFDGVCTGFCGDTDGDAMTPDIACRTPITRTGDPTPTCLTTTNDTPPQQIFNNPNIGLCVDSCTNSPNSCGGVVDNACFVSTDLFNLRVNWNLCVETAPPALPLWNPAGGNAPTPDEECGDRWHRCPADSYCLPVGGGSTACIVGCEAGAAVTGCEGQTIGGSTTLQCTPLAGTTGPGFCEPMP